MKRLVFLAAAIAFLPGCAANVLAAGVLAIESEDERKKASEFDPFRGAQERDCAKAVVDAGASLRCR